jgi:hypothetical protein
VIRPRRRDPAGIGFSTSLTTMIATAHAPASLPTRAREDALHTALLTAAAVIVGTFVIAVVLAASVLMAGPLPASHGAAPLPQMLPQPSAEAGLDR